MQAEKYTEYQQHWKVVPLMIVHHGSWLRMAARDIHRHGRNGETSSNRITFSHVTAGAKDRTKPKKESNTKRREKTTDMKK